MNDDARASKRPRTDNTSDASNSGGTEPGPISQRPRHPKLWFKDGNVVFVTRTMLFCVYQGKMSSMSPVFHDMFSLPQPAPNKENEHEFLEGKPVVEVSDDEAEFSYLLSAIFLQSVFDDRADVTFAEVSAVLRLSSKYEMDDLRIGVIKFIKPFFPDNLTQWANFRSDFNPFGAQHEQECLQLFFDTGLDAFKPAAFLWVSYHEFESIFPSKDAPDVLSPSVRRTLLIGRNKYLAFIHKEVSEFISTLMFELEDPCDSDCHAEVKLLPSSELWRDAVYADTMFDNLETNAFWMSCLCSTCTRRVEHSFTSVRSALWKELPLCFDLPPWETLLQQLKTTLSSQTKI